MFDIVKTISARPQLCTPELFAQTINSKRVGEICSEIADAREQCLRGEMSRDDYNDFKAKKKRSLPGFTFQAHFEGDGRRLDKNAVPSGLCIYDKDHIASPEAWLAEKLHLTMDDLVERPLRKDEAMFRLGIVLAHKTPSGEGLRLVFRVAKGVSPAEAQAGLAKFFGDDDYDPSVKDLARVSFAVPASYIIYLDRQGLFEPTPSDYKMPFPLVKPLKTLKTLKTLTPTSRWKTKKPSPRTMAIVEKAMQLRGITQAALRLKGQRHFMLTNLLSTGVARLLTREELMGAVKKLTPAFAREDDCWRLVEDWYEKYRGDNRPVPRDLALAFASVLKEFESEGKTAGDIPEETTQETQQQDFTLSADDLPIGLRESLQSVPENLRMPVCCALMPIAAAYADRVEVRYADGKRQHLGLMSIIVGEQASKKSVCKDIVDIWKRPMHEDDMAQRKMEDEWKQRRKNKKANEKGEPDPQVLIREIPVTTSCSTLLRRFKNSREHCLYSFGEELDTLRKTNGAGSWSSKYDIYRLSFDRGEWGQDYNSDQAESGIVRVAYNWTILGTYGALKKCFRTDNIENGLSSRVILAEMPDNRFAPLTTFTEIEPADDERIQQAVDQLRQASGFYDTPRLRETMAQWVEEKRVEALQAIDDVKDTYRKRAAVIGFRCGVVFSILAGEENDACLGFARMMADYVLEEQCKLFGEGLAQEREAVDNINRADNQNVFAQLPMKFTVDNLRSIRGKGYSNSAYRMTIYRWNRNGWVKRVSRGVWEKVK